MTNPHHVWSVLECVVIESSNDDGSVSLGLGDSVGLATITCLLSVICVVTGSSNNIETCVIANCGESTNYKHQPLCFELNPFNHPEKSMGDL